MLNRTFSPIFLVVVVLSTLCCVEPIGEKETGGGGGSRNGPSRSNGMKVSPGGAPPREIPGFLAAVDPHAEGPNSPPGRVYHRTEYGSIVATLRGLYASSAVTREHIKVSSSMAQLAHSIKGAMSRNKGQRNSLLTEAYEAACACAQLEIFFRTTLSRAGDADDGFSGSPPAHSPLGVGMSLSDGGWKGIESQVRAQASKVGAAGGGGGGGGGGGWVFLHILPDGRIGVSSVRGERCAQEAAPSGSAVLYALDVHERAYHHTEAALSELEDLWGEHDDADEAEARAAYIAGWAKMVNWAVLNDVYAKRMHIAATQ